MIEHVISRLTYKADTAEHIDELNVCGFRTFALLLLLLINAKRPAGLSSRPAQSIQANQAGRPNGGRKAHPSFETAEPCIL